ncbi:unnamed protein product, partial [marine sediment metagenome]
EDLVVNGDEVFPIGSSIKIPILIEFFKKVEAGVIALMSWLMMFAWGVVLRVNPVPMPTRNAAPNLLIQKYFP